jgi:hypothetical protein
LRCRQRPDGLIRVAMLLAQAGGTGTFRQIAGSTAAGSTGS